MTENSGKILLKAGLMTLAAAGLGIATDLARPDGIPLVTDIPYEIFAPCRDSEVTSVAADVEEVVGVVGERVLYVDARPREVFAREHVRGALNVPYSALFGAEKAEVDRVVQAARRRKTSIVVVYGAYRDPEVDADVDFGKPLAEQLIESGLSGVKHLEGGIEALNKRGVAMVKGDGDDGGDAIDGR